MNGQSIEEQPSPTATRQPRIGDWVLYRFADHKDAVRPACVVRAWSETLVNLDVLTDGQNDAHYFQGENPAWKTSVEFGAGVYQWTWLESN